MNLDDFEDFLVGEGLCGPSTARKRHSLLRHMIDEHGFDLVAYESSQDAARLEARRLMAKLRRLPGMKNSGRGNYTRVLLALNKYLEYDLNVKHPPAEDPEPRAYSREEFQAILAFRYPKDRALERQLRALMHFAYYTAMRPIEISKASLPDLDPERCRVFVRYPAKGSWQRWLPVEREMYAPTRPFGAWMRVVQSAGGEGLWQTRPRRGPPKAPSEDQFRKWMNEVVSTSTAVDAEMYRFRHTRAAALARRHDVIFVKDFLGHRKLETTWNYLRSLQGRLEHTFNPKMPGISDAVE